MNRSRLVATAHELNLITDIVNRALSLFPDRTEMDIRMDILAAHMNCPLKLQELLKADDFNFMHDVAGINRHLNRETFKLENFFRPRFAV